MICVQVLTMTDCQLNGGLFIISCDVLDCKGKNPKSCWQSYTMQSRVHVDQVILIVDRKLLAFISSPPKKDKSDIFTSVQRHIDKWLNVHFCVIKSKIRIASIYKSVLILHLYFVQTKSDMHYSLDMSKPDSFNTIQHKCTKTQNYGDFIVIILYT